MGGTRGAGDVLVVQQSVKNERMLPVTTTLSSTVPPQTSFSAGASGLGWTCSDGAGAGSVCTRLVVLGGLGSTVVVPFAVQVDADHLGGTLTTQPSLPTQGDLDPTNNTSAVVTTVDAPLRDLAVRIAEPVDSLEPGARIEYTVTVENPEDVEQTVIVETTPDAGTTFVAAESDPAWQSLATGATAEVTVPAMGSTTLTLVVEVNEEAVPDDKHEFVAVVQLPDDADLSNNGASVATPIVDVSVTTDGGGLANPGELLDYMHTVSNLRGRETTTTLTSTVTPNASFVGGNPGWNCSVGAAGTTCTLDLTLAANGSETITFGVEVDADARDGIDSVVVEAMLPTTNDLNPGNNASSIADPIPADCGLIGCGISFPAFGGSGPRLDGQPVPDGTTVSAYNEIGLFVGSGDVHNGEWRITVFDLSPFGSVRFRIGQSTASDPFFSFGGDEVEVTLDLRTSTVRNTSGWTQALPTLDDSGGPLPAFTVDPTPPCSQVTAANVFCIDPNGNVLLTPAAPPPPIVPTTTTTSAATFTSSVAQTGSVSGTQTLGGCEWGFGSCAVTRVPVRSGVGLDLEVAQAGSPFLDSPVRLTNRPGPIDRDPAGLQYFRVTAAEMIAVPTEVDYADGAVSASIDQQGTYVLLGASARDIALPAGTAALGFHGAPGTPPALLQGQLADPSALQVMFQFRDGVWLVYRPSGPSILNSLTAIDAHAPLFLSLSRATRWAGPLLFGDRDVAIGSGFTAVTYTGLEPITPEGLMAQFSNASAVTALFAYDNERGGYRIFRASGPSVLNDLAEINTFDVFFVLASRSTSLAVPEFVLPE